MTKTDRNQELSERQKKAIPFLVQSPTVEDGCKAAKISRETYYQWLANPLFKDELKRQRDQVIEDALKFVKRESKRGNKYNGIILDPPAYGRGPDGEKWLLEDQINEMMELCSSIMLEEDKFLILNLYSVGYSPFILENLVNSKFRNIKNREYGELFIPDAFGKKLPLGVFLRFTE